VHEVRRLGGDPNARFDRYWPYPHPLYEVTVSYAATGPVQEDEVLMEVSPYAALAFLSALVFHQLTDALPKEITAMIPQGGVAASCRRTPTSPIGRNWHWCAATPRSSSWAGRCAGDV
jgi:hypothetical protein